MYFHLTKGLKTKTHAAKMTTMLDFCLLQQTSNFPPFSTAPVP